MNRTLLLAYLYSHTHTQHTPSQGNDKTKDAGEIELEILCDFRETDVGCGGVSHAGEIELKIACDFAELDSNEKEVDLDQTVGEIKLEVRDECCV
jgi:hypothetical protein